MTVFPEASNFRVSLGYTRDKKYLDLTKLITLSLLLVFYTALHFNTHNLLYFYVRFGYSYMDCIVSDFQIASIDGQQIFDCCFCLSLLN